MCVYNTGSITAVGSARLCLEILGGQNGAHGKFPADEATGAP